MKRIFSLLLCTSFILSFSACGMSAEITEADTAAAAETTTVSVTTTPEATTETAISTISEYEKFNSKDNAAGENAERFAELYSKYCEFFAGNTGYDGFYSSIGKHFADIDGKLSATIMAQGFMGGGFLEWSRRKTLIFDVTDETAEVLVAVPETIMNDDPRDYEIYTFFHISLVNTENGWRLTDEMYYSMN